MLGFSGKGFSAAVGELLCRMFPIFMLPARIGDGWDDAAIEAAPIERSGSIKHVVWNHF